MRQENENYAERTQPVERRDVDRIAGVLLQLQKTRELGERHENPHSNSLRNSMAGNIRAEPAVPAEPAAWWAGVSFAATRPSPCGPTDARPQPGIAPGTSSPPSSQ